MIKTLIFHLINTYKVGTHRYNKTSLILHKTSKYLRFNSKICNNVMIN
jgi:hypothetical protein